MNGYEETVNEESGNRGGRPRLLISADAVARLRDAGCSWRTIARQLGVGYGTVRRAYQRRAKTVPKPIPGPSAIHPEQEIQQKAEAPVFGFARTKRFRRRALVALVAFFALAFAAYGQGGIPASPIIVVDSQGKPRGGVTVTICTSGATGVPCTPLASIFTDVGLTTPATNPTTTDAN